MNKWQRTVQRKPRLKQTLFVVLLATLAVASMACSSLLDPRVSPPTLTLRQPAHVGTHWEAVLSVSDMPNGGIMGICIADGGITITDASLGTTTAEGMNGFAIAAQDFAAPAPAGALLAVATSTPLASGKLLKISFRTSNPNPQIALDTSKVSLSDATGTWIPEWTLHITSAADSD